VCGQFNDCGDPEQVRALLHVRLGRLGVPVVHDAPVGHGPTNTALPFGAQATLDADGGTLTVDDALR
jgi:muramoyltetrapeptide carboxypeptidase